MINLYGNNNALSSSCPTLSKPHYQSDLDSSSLNSSPTHTDLSSTFDSTNKKRIGHSKFFYFIHFFFFLIKFFFKKTL